MGLREDIEEWRQPDGLIVPRQERPGTENPDSTGDGIKHFCIYHALLVRRGESRPEDRAEFERVIDACLVRSGLPHRSPTKTGEQISKDALVGIAYAAKILSSRKAWEILNRGNASRFLWLKWFYANLFPTVFDPGNRPSLKLIFSRGFWEAWMGKNPEVIYHFQACGLPPGHSPTAWRMAWFCAHLLLSSTSKGTIYSLSYMMCHAASGRGPIGDFFIELWRGRINKAGGMKARMMEEYDADHPLVRHWHD